MNNENNIPTSVYDDLSLEAPVTAQSLRSDDVSKHSLGQSLLSFQHRKTLLLVNGSVLLLIALIGVTAFFLSGSPKQAQTGSSQNPTNYTVSSLAVGGVKAGEQLQVGQADLLTINGQLDVGNTLVLAPTAMPSKPTAGQIYYDQSTNQPYYYNGTHFISFSQAAAAQGVASIGGSSGSIGIGSGLQLIGNQLALQLQAGNGVAVTGATISNNGVVSLTSGTSNIIISHDSKGNYTISDNAVDVVTGAGTAGQIPLFGAGESLGDSILSQGGSTVTAAGSLNITGSVAIQGTATAGAVSVGSNTSLSTTTLTIGGTAVCTSAGCNTSAGGFIVNSSSLQPSSNFNISGNGTAGSFISSFFTSPTLASLQIASNATLALTSAAGATNTVTLDSGTTGAVNVGTGSNAKTITVGNTTGATAVTIQAGTGNLQLTTQGTGTLGIGNNAVAQTIAVGNTTGATSLTLQGGTGGVQVGTGGIANTVQIGNTTGAVAQTINIGTNPTAGSTSTINLGVASAGATGVSIQAGTGGINIGTAAGLQTIDIGNSSSATSVSILNGTGTITVGGGGGGSVLLEGGSGVSGCTVNPTGIGSFTCVGTVTANGLLTGNAGLTVTGAAVNLNASSNFATNINTGTSTGTVSIGNNTGNTPITIDSGTSAINIGTGAQARTINLGTGAAAETVNIGSKSGTSPVTIQSGTSGVAVAGAASTTAFQVQNSSNSALLTGDTSNMRLGVDVTYTAMSAPTGLASSPISGGSLVAGAYLYEVTAVDSAGGETAISNEATGTPSGSNLTNALTWTAVPGASGYKVYRTAWNGSSGTEKYLTAVPGNSYNDTGATAIAANASTPPSSNTAYVSSNTSNNSLQLSVGGNGTPTGQVYVGGTVPSSALSTTPTGVGATSTYVQGSYAYVVAESDHTLQIFDISNPASPVSVSSVSTGASSASVYVQGRYAYVANSSATYFEIFDISNPASPVEVSSVVGTGTSASSVYVQGRYAYVNKTSNHTLQIFDISNPASPVSVGSAITGSSNTALYVQGRYAYVVSSSGLQIFDISNPANPTNVGTVIAGTHPNSITVQGRYAYVANSVSSSLQIFDISNPANPTNVGTVSSSGPSSVKVQGRYAYVTNSSATLQTFDISNPTAPVSVGSVSTGTTPSSVFTQGRYAYVTNFSSDTLQVFDLGGAYIQQLQTGGTETGTLQVDANASVGGDAAIQGGLQVGTSLQVAGSTGINGNLVLAANALSTPAAPTLSSSGSGGSLPAATYYYELAAINANGSTAAVASSPASVTTSGSVSQNTLSWAAVIGATGYIVYESTNGSTWFSNEVSSSTTSLTDNGTAYSWTNHVTPPTTATSGGNLEVEGTALFQNATNSTNAFQVQNASGSVTVLDVDTADSNGRVGIGTNAPGNLLSIGALTTASATSQLAISTGGTSDSGIVVQTVVGQSSGNILQAQDSTGAVLATLDYQGNLTVKAATINGTLTVNGHVITGNSSGSTTASVNGNAGSGSSCSVTGNDTGGQITLTTGSTGWAAGTQCTINFASSYTSAPHPVIASANATSVTAVQPYAGSSTGSFTLNFINADSSSNTYVFNYFNAQ